MSCRHNFKLRAIGSVYTCTKCDMYVSVEMYQQLQQARREGWEQAKAEAVKAVKPEVYPNNKCIVNTIFQCAVAIAEMEYKERTNG